MHICFHKSFKKALRKQPASIQRRFFEVIDLFVEDQFHYSLNNHALQGEFRGWRSINVTGDVRIHYEEMVDGIVLMDIGTHAQLYE
jgi:addiction module RelE/StbE family toxin